MKKNDIIGGKYIIVKIIGSGGMGNVYLAEDIHLGRKAAVKEAASYRSDKASAALRSEMEMMKAFSGKRTRLPELYDWIEENGSLYLVMEYIEGVTLRDHLKQGHHLNEKKAVEWGLEILQALSLLHEMEPPAVYQDLKSSNVIICRDGSIRLIDFGASFRMRYDGTVQRGIGTSGYAAPEQCILGGMVCAQSDVFSWGRLMQEMLSGIDMGRSGSCAEQAAAVYGNEISYGLLRIIRKCTAERLEDRYRCAGEVISALDGCRRMNWLYSMHTGILRICALIPAALAIAAGFARGVFSHLMKLSFEEMSSWKTVIVSEKYSLTFIAAMIVLSYILYENIGIRHCDRIRRINGIYLTECRESDLF